MNRLTKAQLEFMNGYVPANIHDIYEYATGGGIHIDPSKKGTFKAQATRMNMGVQEAAKTNPKAQKRLEQLMQNVELTPNYQNGGKTFLQPVSDKLPEGYRIPFSNPSTELAMSIGGENGEPAYLIPSFKYGRPLADPILEFRNTGEHLGGPFKTWQEADEWERTVRHPAVENRETIMFPQEKFQTGGSMPGAVGFTYARTQGIPSEGPYAKKTMPSAQNGQEMKYYQEGLDWRPKIISRDGVWLDGHDVAQTGTEVLANKEKALQMLADIQKRKQGKSKPSTEFSNVKIKNERKEAVTKADNTRSKPKLKVTDVNKLNVRNKTEQELAEQERLSDEAIAAERRAIRERSDANPLNQGFSGFFNSENQTRQNWEDSAAGLESKFRVSDKPNFFDDYLNPLSAIGGMAADLGAAPNQIVQQDSMAPLIGAIATPLLTGAIEGIGAKSNKQFVNNLVNPFNIVPGYKSAEKYVSNRLGNVRTNIASKLKQRLRTADPSFGSSVDNVTPTFKSEIDWGKWNKEIPENKALMQEYNTIEQQAKANGTWMKNPDGSTFNGTPEQFVQQNSENFKKAFGNSKVLDEKGNPKIMYHGTRTSDAINKEGFSKTMTGKGNRGAKNEDFYFTDSKKNADYTGIGEDRNFKEHFNNMQSAEDILKQNKFISYEDLNSKENVLRNKLSELRDRNRKKNIFSKNFEKDIINTEKELENLKYIRDVAVKYAKTKTYLNGNPNNIMYPFNIESLPIPKNVTQEVKDMVLNQVYDTKGLKYSPDILETYLNVENPIIKDFGYKSTDVNPLFGTMSDRIIYSQKVEPLLKKLHSGNYDGSIQNNLFDILHSNIVTVKHPTQIKSAIGNNGMFDMTNPNIYKSVLPFVGYTGAGTLTYKALQGQEETPEYKQGGIIKDDRGQWAHPGEITEIGSNDITMQGVPYPVLGISDEGDTKLMKPGKNYKFKGKKVTEFPMAKNGVNQADENSLVKLDQLTNWTNYNTKQKGGWLDNL